MHFLLNGDIEGEPADVAEMLCGVIESESTATLDEFDTPLSPLKQQKPRMAIQLNKPVVAIKLLYLISLLQVVDLALVLHVIVLVLVPVVLVLWVAHVNMFL